MAWSLALGFATPEVATNYWNGVIQKAYDRWKTWSESTSADRLQQDLVIPFKSFFTPTPANVVEATLRVELMEVLPKAVGVKCVQEGKLTAGDMMYVAMQML